MIEIWFANHKTADHAHEAWCVRVDGGTQFKQYRDIHLENVSGHFTFTPGENPRGRLVLLEDIGYTLREGVDVLYISGDYDG